ncbi:unnamed protein product, partial [Prorocentrum cordatum]
APGDEGSTRPVLVHGPFGGAENVLLVAELHAGGGLGLGDALSPSETDVAVGPKVIGRRAGGHPVLCEGAAISDVESWRAQAFENAPSVAASALGLAEPPPAADDRPVDLRDTLRAPPGEAGGASAPREGRQVEQQAEGVRTLAVEWNEQGVRFKEWRRAVGEGSEEALGGCELRGAGAALHLWMSNFCRECGIYAASASEAATFDALGLGCLACREVAARRVARITEAHRVSPGQPAARGAGRVLTGASHHFHAVSPELRNFAIPAAPCE